jgi:hypothetical protein
MVVIKILTLIFGLVLTTSCDKNIESPDQSSYKDYAQSLSMLSLDSKEVIQYFKSQKDSYFVYKTFPQYNISVVIFFNKLLKQKYIYIYDGNSTSNILPIIYSPSEPSFGLKAKFNQNILKIFFDLKPFLFSQINKNFKSIIIGYRLGGVLAHLTAIDAITSLNFSNNNFEVITFGGFNFVDKFKPNYNFTSIILNTDSIRKVKSPCCDLINNNKLYIRFKGYIAQDTVQDYYQSL